MDRGDTGFIIHESFKDLKARRAEQEAYRKALEEQIAQKRRLQEQERDKYAVVGRRTHNEASTHASQRFPDPSVLPSSHVQPVEPLGVTVKPPTSTAIDSLQSTPLHGESRPLSRGRVLSFHEIDNFNEPHPVAVLNAEDKSAHNIPTTPGLPEFSPECMKYLQQVMPGFTLPPLLKTPAEFADSENRNHTVTKEADKMTPANGSCDANVSYPNHSENDQAFSSGTTSESSSVEDVQSQTKMKIHVSQTSEQLEGVKVSRKQYREELQKQIDERKRREEELRRKAEEEEAKIQEKIRIDQEKMKREYEEDLRRQQEIEKEAEKKRMAALAKAKQKEIQRAQQESRGKCNDKKEKMSGQRSERSENPAEGKSAKVIATSSSSEESIESIGEFFDETTSSQRKYVNPDERIIPVVAKRLIREKSLKNEKRKEEESGEHVDLGNPTLTARIDSVFSDPNMTTVPRDQGPPLPQTREMALRSAPCPPTTNSTDLKFLSTLKSYLQSEKDKMDARICPKISKSTEKF